MPGVDNALVDAQHFVARCGHCLLDPSNSKRSRAGLGRMPPKEPHHGPAATSYSEASDEGFLCGQDPPGEGHWRPKDENCQEGCGPGESSAEVF